MFPVFIGTDMTETKSMIAQVTDGEMLTNYQVLPLSRCPWWFLCVAVLDGCQKELQHFREIVECVKI